jgi:hypothetical protein
MTCAEFQKVLPYIIETGGNAEEEQHLRDCPVCSDLVADLKYIAEQAKLLVPMEDPDARVWEGIRGSLEREGMIKPARARGRLLGPQRSSSLPWVIAAAAVVIVALGAFIYQRERGRPIPATTAATVTDAQPPAQTPSLQMIATDQDDQQLLSHVEAKRPAVRDTYAETLKQVNASIADAKKSVEQNPDDENARQSLVKAYEQKAMLYDMALRSME